MAIVKMVAVTIAGKIENFDRAVNQYVCNREIHLENAISVLGNKKRLSAFDDSVRYDSIVKNAEDIIALAGFEAENAGEHTSGMKPEDMQSFLDGLNLKLEEKKQQRDTIDRELEENQKSIKSMEHMKNIDCDISGLGELEFVRCRFGRLPKGGYKMLETYLADLDIVFQKTDEDENNIWGFYFVTREDRVRVDDIFTSLYFERVIFPRGIKGSPKAIAEELRERNTRLRLRSAELEKESRELITEHKAQLMDVYQTAKKRRQLSNVRELAAHSEDYFYIVGWMAKRDAAVMQAEADKDEDILLFYSENPDNLKDIVKPPTKLKNNIVFKPFEFFVRMYGYPAYNEIDPTPLLAITYILFFGMMFGDLGQSLLFVIGGFLVYKLTKLELARIVGIVGISGSVFGVLYGSVFGNEEIIHGVLPPMENITTLLIGTVAIGGFIIILGMLLNVINSCKNRKIGEMLFGHNGIAGLAFYASAIALVLSFLGLIKLPTAVFVGVIIVSLLAIYLNEPLSKLIEGRRDWMPKDAMFYVQSLFEMVEVLLSYFSNTISFLRIGAFAIVHVGMMKAVEVLAGAGGARFIIVSILGNLLVMVLEGIVVGIQVLRLEYYEMFSRYFTGNGKSFTSIKNK